MVFSWFMAFYIGKKIPLDTLDVVFLFLLTGNSNLLTYADLLYTHNSNIGCFQSVGGVTWSFLLDPLGSGSIWWRERGPMGDAIQKGLFYWTILAAVGFTFPDGDLRDDLVSCSIYTRDAPVRPRRDYSSLLADIFCVAVAVDILVYCASRFMRGTHDTACFINNSIK